ncbi:MAG: hypothetical protein U1C97_02250, partial [Candidatus Gracilibacteria bacterium]|nr:hypothetical protein [Candidatus Gracilibacteria bacterium]
MLFAGIIAICILLGAWGRIVMKKALEHKPPLICALIFEIVQVAVALPLFFFYEAPETIFFSFISGGLFSASLVLYFMSFVDGEVSLLTPFRSLRGLVALIISILWWHEALTAGEVTG